MTPLVVSVALGAAIYLIYDGLTNPRPAAERRRLRGVEDFLRRAGLHDVTPGQFVLFSLGAGALVGTSAQLLLGWGLVSALAALLGTAAPFAYYLHRHERRRAAVQGALVDAIAQLRDAIRTGLSVPEAMASLARSGPEPLRPEFETLVRDMALDGFEPALVRMRDRLADPLFDVVAASLLLSDALGGRNASRVLDRLQQSTRAQLRVQEELTAYQARNKLSARIVAAVPLIVLVGIRQVNPSYLAVFDDWAGQLLLAGSVVSIAIGYAAMLWTTRLPGEPRVMR